MKTNKKKTYIKKDIVNILTKHVYEKHISNIIYTYSDQMIISENNKKVLKQLKIYVKEKNVNKNFSEYTKKNKIVRYYNYQKQRRIFYDGTKTTNDMLIFNYNKTRSKFELKTRYSDYLYNFYNNEPYIKTSILYFDNDLFLNKYMKRYGFRF